MLMFFIMCILTQSELKRIFEKLDMNGDGLLSLEELNWLPEKIGNFEYSLEELESLVEKKSLDFNEFLSFYESISKKNDGKSRGGEIDAEELERDLVKTFDVFDLDGDGFISSQELEFVLKKLGLWNGKDCRSMIRFYDINLDGQLDFQEFKTMMLHSTA